jgi:hypothetical protein
MTETIPIKKIDGLPSPSRAGGAGHPVSWPPLRRISHQQAPEG